MIKFFGLHCVKLTGPAQKKVENITAQNSSVLQQLEYNIVDYSLLIQNSRLGLSSWEIFSALTILSIDDST